MNAFLSLLDKKITKVHAVSGPARKYLRVGSRPRAWRLEGSVRKAGNRVRISSQLVDAITGGHIWAERYDHELTDIFDLQDEVTQQIVSALAVNLTKQEEDRLAHRGTDNLIAYDYVLQGQECYYRFTREANVKAQEMFEKSIELDPRYAASYSWLGLVLLHRWTHGWSQDPQLVDRAFESAQRAIGLGLSVAYGIIKNHGGDISVSSEPGKGSIFVIKLPVIEENQEANT